MLKTYLYIPDELNEAIEKEARAKKMSKAAVIRTALEKNLLNGKRKKDNKSIDFLYEVAKLGRKHNIEGSKHASRDIDKDLWAKRWD